ncbi:hypothetical protein COU88_05545 [Candidatus Roizmanbacteria bacterium CG10_big_fil_rev_8_21_14_0_10_39_6]|uniref:Uncharacterized protein n=1 Tax=Candidatus Roizmanbacteria bacterium CG10_big_fil_rev_8_21_14_0_10_39_6 TaxID=1974853 RepID=A0A2M8KR08_9BACT|nr:MAG: hypothetical protein COU88_05545 [Candidatus Roizmanbacteria bacterium CG10_big_fil_rev_8_21_14_0_10_39_6]
MNKKIAAGSVVILIVVFGLVWWMISGKSNSSNSPEQTEKVLMEGEVMKQVEKSVKVQLVRDASGKKAILTIDGIPQKYTEIEYKLAYITGAGVPRGVLGTIQVDGDTYEKDIVLGSCSTNICTYDEGVTEVDATLKFNSSSGSTIFEKKFKL